MMVNGTSFCDASGDDVESECIVKLIWVTVSSDVDGSNSEIVEDYFDI